MFMEKFYLARRNENTGFVILFLAGFALGILIVYGGQNYLLENTEFLSTITISGMKYLEVDKGLLFFYCLRQRLGIVSVLVLASAAGLAMAAVCAVLLWSGFSAGVMLSVLSARHGIRGILLFVGGTLPQILIYVPAFLFLFSWCMHLKRRDGQGDSVGKGKTFLIILVVVITGCLIESYVNPWVLKFFLKLF